MAKSNSQKGGVIRINILEKPSERLPIHLKFFKWLLSSGRFIVVVVELIVISAFVYRYKLDTDLINLKEEIETQSEFVTSLQADEAIIRKTQFQINSIKEIKNQNPDFSEALITISKLAPAGVRISNINFDRTQAFPKTSIALVGQANTNLDLAAFLKALQTDPNFTEITLTNISLEAQTVFTITGNLVTSVPTKT